MCEPASSLRLHASAREASASADRGFDQRAGRRSVSSEDLTLAHPVCLLPPYHTTEVKSGPRDSGSPIWRALAGIKCGFQRAWGIARATTFTTFVRVPTVATWDRKYSSITTVDILSIVALYDLEAVSEACAASLAANGLDMHARRSRNLTNREGFGHCLTPYPSTGRMLGQWRLQAH
jgi:hypothetical protein